MSADEFKQLVAVGGGVSQQCDKTATFQRKAQAARAIAPGAAGG
jgi:hypothetical protein